MPAKLPEEMTAVKWLIASDDLNLLRALYEDGEGGTNGAVRSILRLWCDAQRRKLAGRGGA